VAKHHSRLPQVIAMRVGIEPVTTAPVEAPLFGLAALAPLCDAVALPPGQRLLELVQH
jgi:hypothetical protein